MPPDRFTNGLEHSERYLRPGGLTPALGERSGRHVGGDYARPVQSLERVRCRLEAGPTTDGPTGYGALSRLVWRVAARLTRHERQYLVEALLAVVDELRSQRRGAEHAVLNRGTGQQVVSWYGPVIGQALAGAEFDALVESVSTDAGEILFPRFDRWLLPTLRSTGRWEPDEAAFVRAHLAPAARALNVGANVGYLTLIMAQAVGSSGLVIGLEPEPFNFDLFWTNIRRNRAYNVLPIQTAAGEATGTTWLNLSPDNTGDHRTAPHPIGVGRLEVPMVAVDDLLGELDVDLVVSDAQGYDHRVLRGMATLIKRRRPPMLVEFWPPGIFALGDSPVDVIDEYREFGYRMRIVEGDRDVTGLAAPDVVDIVLSGRDHVTLALT